MKVQFGEADALPFSSTYRVHATVSGETERLTEVLLCAPTYLEPVPCCSRTRESLRGGFEASHEDAHHQHDALRGVLEAHGVRCHELRPEPQMPDLCFTRDATVTTPWGVVMLNPAMPHRACEVDYVAGALTQLGAAPVERIRAGHIEGGDVCIARRGLLMIGISDERTNLAGAASFAAPFQREGWDVVHCPLDPHFLHLDTIFCMLDPVTALACVDVLDDGFLAATAAHGIRLIPTTYKEARDLGGNILSLDGHTILCSDQFPRIGAELRRADFETIELDISQFAACGGGLHCLTMPLTRRSNNPSG